MSTGQHIAHNEGYRYVPIDEVSGCLCCGNRDVAKAVIQTSDKKNRLTNFVTIARVIGDVFVFLKTLLMS